MALWGNKDALALTGTVATTNGSATLTGTSTLFTTEVQNGDVVRVNGTLLKVVVITSNTALTISPTWSIANTSGVSATARQSPKWMPAGSDKTVQSAALTFGVDAGEATANNEIPGWVYTNVYTDMHGNIRRKTEVLASIGSISTDGEDTIYPDYRFSIATQPTSKSVTSGTANTFTIVATSVPTGATINYRWQQAANANASFVDLTNTGTWTNTTTATVNFANSSVAGTGSIYRVQMSVTGGTGANTVSANATLTVV
jgi:hypothetical protein